MSCWAALGEEETRGLLRWVDEVLELSRWVILEGEAVLGVLCCVEEALRVSCWVDEVLGLSRWVDEVLGVSRWAAWEGEEARGASSCTEAVWAASLWAERWREEAWGVVLRGPLCGVAEEARCRSKKCPLSPRSFAQCCPALRLPPPGSKREEAVHGEGACALQTEGCPMRDVREFLASWTWLIPPGPWHPACNLGPCHQADRGGDCL